MIRRRHVAWIAAAGGLLAVAAAIALWTPRPRMNVLVITLDTTRADRLGCYGHAQALTPVLDELAARGVLFERAYAAAPLTLPSHATLFTGLYPPEHGLRTNGKNRLGADIPTLAEVLSSHGYETGAFIAAFVLDSKFGLDRGFGAYGDDLSGTAPADEALHRYRSGDRVVDEALAWLDGHSQSPFLCWVHLYDPHFPYLDHQDLFGERFVDRPYDAEIAFVDQQVGRLLQFLKSRQLDEQTLVVVVGDHGEGLGDHQERRHGQMLYGSTMHIPLILSLPGDPGGRRVADPVSLVDLFPTILDFLRLRPGSPVSGRSLLSAAQGGRLESRGVYGETDEPLLESGWSPLRSLTTQTWKYIRTPRVELYDLLADPAETRNLAADRPDQVRLLEEQLADLERRMRSREAEMLRLSEEERKRLAGLGYVGHARSSPADAVERPDIKDRIAHYNALDDARALMGQGKLRQATARLEELVAAAPDYEEAELALGMALFRQEKYDEAIALCERVLKRNPESALAHSHLAEVRLSQGRLDEALAHFEEALRREPDLAKLQYNAGRTLMLLGRDEEAIPRFETALELDPGYVFAHIELGSALARRELWHLALDHHEPALPYAPQSPFAHMNAAMVLARLGRGAEALRHLEQAAEASPQDPEIRFHLGAALANQNQPERAIEQLAEAVRLKPDHAAARALLETLKARPVEEE